MSRTGPQEHERSQVGFDVPSLFATPDDSPLNSRRDAGTFGAINSVGEQSAVNGRWEDSDQHDGRQHDPPGSGDEGRDHQARQDVEFRGPREGPRDRQGAAPVMGARTVAVKNGAITISARTPPR